MDKDWQGDLNNDCSLERYGMLAHAEKMDTNRWWFAISRGDGTDLFNFADREYGDIRLTTGKMARAAAECCMELLRGLGPIGAE